MKPGDNAELEKISDDDVSKATVLPGHTNKGIIKEMEVGKPFSMLRYEKNGEPSLGLFLSSIVTHIVEKEDKAVFKTEHSIYKVRKLC